MTTATMVAEPPAAGPPEDVGTDASSRQFVTFTVRGETFAVPLAEVQEIIRMPDVVRLPLSPPSLEGLANLRGAVLPVINLRTVFECEARDHDDSTRVVVLDQGRPVGLVVDRMANVVTVDLERIEQADAIRSSVEAELLTGMIKGSDQAMVMILDAAALVRREIRSIGRRLAGDEAAQGLRAGDGAQSDDTVGDEIQLVSFVVAGQEYAFPIENVQEIVQVPERITRVPNSEAFLLGVITLRDRLLPLVSLRSLFSLPARELSEQDRIVVISLGRGSRDEMAVGVVMDSVKEVLRVNRALVDAVPPLLARDQHLQDLTAICRLDGGGRLVSVLSAEKMFHNTAIRDAAGAVAASEGDRMVAERGQGAGGADDEEQFVVFRLLAEEYGVAIDSVQEIVRVPEQLTQIPRSPAFIEGVVNLRGMVLPVVDQRRRFGLPSCERSDRQRIMVFAIRGTRTGFIVDSVSEVMRIPRSAIGPAPDLSEEQSRMIRRVANLERQQRMILLLDVDELLDRNEIADLAKG